MRLLAVSASTSFWDPSSLLATPQDHKSTVCMTCFIRLDLPNANACQVLNVSQVLLERRETLECLESSTSSPNFSLKRQSASLGSTYGREKAHIRITITCQ